MKKNLLLLLLVLTSLDVVSQELLNSLVLKERVDGAVFRLSEEVIQDGDRMYYRLAGVNKDEFDKLDLDVDIDTVYSPVIYDSVIESDICLGATILLEINENSEIIDHTYINDGYRPLAIDNDIMAVGLNNFGGLDNNIFYGDTSDYRTYSNRDDFMVYDKKRDSVLYHYIDDEVALIEGVSSKFQWKTLEIDGDFVYYATTFANEQTFMGDTLYHLNPELFIQFTTMLHKINWRTGKKLWSRHMGAIDWEDRVRQIKVVDDGSIILEMMVNGPFTWEQDTLDPPHFVNTGGGSVMDRYNVVVAKISQDGDLINHINLKAYDSRSFQSVQIEENGNVYAYGLLSAWSEVEIGPAADTLLYGKEGVTKGILFAMDNDLNLRWYKEYVPDDFGMVMGVNEDKSGNVIATVYFNDFIEVGGQVYENRYKDEPTNSNQSLLILYDELGNIKSDPIKVGKRDRFRDIIETSPNNYLLFLYTDVLLGENSYFFDTTIGVRNTVSVTFLEVQDLFGPVSSAEEVAEVEENSFTISPNPSQDYIVISDLPTIHSGKRGNVQIHDLQGNLIKESSTTFVSREAKLDVSMLTNGIYVVTINDDKRKYASKFIKY